MDQLTTIVLAVGALAILAAATFMVMARRGDVRGAGALSAETRRRDRTARAERADRAEAGETGAAPPETGAPTTVAASGGGRRPLTAEEAEARGAIARYGSAVEKAPPVYPAVWQPPDPEVVGVDRRMFLNRAAVSLTATGLGAFAAAGFVAFLWPTSTGGFGQPVNAGKMSDIDAGITAGSGFFYVPEAKAWITPYPPDAVPKAQAVYDPLLIPGMEAGIVALYQKCPHLGCRVPQCVSSQWFECPCHGSQYNHVGEKKAGPAPRGMDRFPVTIAASGVVTINTGTVIQGPPIGTNTTGQEAEGPHCIGGSSEH